MKTVLPTPAPPKRPILPPLAYGASRSTTLMPVTSTSASVDCSVNSGGSVWMGIFFTPSMGPRSSRGSPVTFMMRPRVPGPTGTRMGPPVSTTSVPRTRPSVPVTVTGKRGSRAWSSRREPPLTVHGDTPDSVFAHVLLRAMQC
jgi:hypothetical protein